MWTRRRLLVAILVVGVAAAVVALVVVRSIHGQSPTRTSGGDAFFNGLESVPPPGTTFCDLQTGQPPVASILTRLHTFGRGQWSVEIINANDLARLAPPSIAAPAQVLATAVRAWPDDHAAIDAPDVVAAAHQLDVYVASHCPSGTTG